MISAESPVKQGLAANSEMHVIDNINSLLGDELKDSIRPGARLKVAASCFPVCVYELLSSGQSNDME